MKSLIFIFTFIVALLLVSCAGSSEDSSDDQLADEHIDSTFDEMDSNDIMGDDDIEENVLSDDMYADIDMDSEPLPGDDADYADIDSEIETFPDDNTVPPKTILAPPSYYSTSRTPFYLRNDGYPENNNVGSSQGSYMVRKGDTLWSIARHFGTTVDAIARVNNISRNGILRIGKSLIIPSDYQKSYTPSTYSGGQTYTVRKGDTFYSIARSYNIGTKKLMDYNGARSSFLKIGQSIRIP